MAGSDLDGRRVKPAISVPRTGRWRVVPPGAVSKYAILGPSASSTGAYTSVSLASNAVFVASTGPLFIATHAVTADGASGPSLLVSSRFLVTGQDTSGRAVGDPVYLAAAAGTVTFTQSTTGVQRRIGTVLTVSATDGAWLFDGTAPMSKPLFVGTATVTNGNNNVIVNGFANALNDRPVVATLNAVDGTLCVAEAHITSNNLVITLSGNTTDDRTVAYAIF